MSNTTAFFLSFTTVVFLDGVVGAIITVFGGPYGFVIAIPLSFCVGFFDRPRIERFYLNLKP